MADLIPLDPVVSGPPPLGAIQLDPIPPGNIQPDQPAASPGIVSSFLGALASGAKRSLTDVAGVVHPFTDQSPIQPDTGPTAKLLAEPFSQGKFDPAWYAARLGQGIGGSGPMLGGAIVGGAAGEAVEPVGGGLVGAPAGAFVGSVVQELAPAYQAARAAGQSHDQAVDTAIKSATVSGATGALMTIAPIFKLFGTTVEGALKRPISEALAQIFAVQPAIGTLGAAAQGAVTGQPLTPEQLAESYVTNAGVGAAMVGAHALLPSLRGGAPAAEGAAVAPEPITLDRAPAAPAGGPSPDLAPGAVVGIRGPDGLPQRAQIQRVGDGLVHWVGEDGTPQVDDLPAFQRDVTAAPAPLTPEPPARPAGEPPITQPDQFVQQFRNGPIEPDVPLSPEKQMPLPMPQIREGPSPLAPDLARLQELSAKSAALNEAKNAAVEAHGPESPQATAAFDALDAARQERDALDAEINARARGEVPPAPVPDSLYVQRPVLNAQELHDWAVKQGIPNVVPAEDMHVTQVYSRTSADISPLANEVMAKPAAEGVAPLGDQGAVVLHLDSPELQARFGEAKDAGASHDYPEFQPHVTLSYSAPDADLKAAGTPPFPIQLGAETHAPVDENAGARNQAATAPPETPDAMRADLAAAGAHDAATIADADLPERWAQLQAVQPEAPAKAGEVTAPGYEFSDLNNLPTSEDVSRMIDAARMSDNDKMLKALGTPEAVKDFNRLDRAMNSSNPDRADKATAEFHAKFGDHLTPEQERLIYGIGERGYQVDDLQTMRGAIDATDFLPDESPARIAMEAQRGLFDLSRQGTRDFMGAVKGQYGATDQAAAIRFARSYKGLQERGLSGSQIDHEITGAMVSRGIEPSDAADILGGIKEDMQGARPPQSAAAPEPIAAQPKAIAGPTETPTEAVIPGLSGEKTVADPGAVATGIKQAAKSFGDMLMDDNGSVPRREKTLTDAERIAAEVKASQPDSLRSISGIAQHTALAQTIAETDPLGARYLDARQNRNAARHAYQADAQAAGSAWLRLPEARQKAVDKVLEYQTMMGREVQDTGRPVVVHYDAARDFPGRPNPLQIIKDGETVRLSPAESKMVHDMNGFFDRAWKQSAQADATKFGYTGSFLKEGVGGRLDFDKAAIQSAIDNAVDKGARLAAERAMGFSQAAEETGRQGYFPLMRYGDWTIAVTPKVPKNPEGYPLRDEGWFAKVDSKDPFASLKGQIVGEDLTKTPKRVAQEMARLKQRFPDADYHMTAKRQAPKTADTVDLAMVSRVLSDTKLTDPETGKRLADDVIAKLYDEAKAGYKHPREGIPGYSTDFARAYSDYARQWSSVTASKLHGNTVQDAYDATQVGPDRRAAKYWDAYHQHNENPQPWIYGAMKRVGFFNYLWGSPSSAMIQLTQTPLITGTQLGLLVGHTRAQYMANTLAARALSAVRTGRSGLVLDVKDMPGVTARERTALAQADREGRLNPVLPTDFAGGQFSPEMRRRFAPAVRVYDIGASMFNTADRANRIASWLSAYRAAQLPGMAAKAARIYRNDALYREQVGPQMEPAKYANWFTNETQFLSGREGSSPLMRGAGSVLFQFQHYNTNMLRLMRKNLVKMGPEGKAAFGVMLTGLVLGAGVGGLPFVNDAERLANQVGKWINDGVDPRLDARFHEMIADSGFAQMAAAYFGTDPLHVAEFAMEGGSRSVLGLDLGRRIGLGNILPSNTDLFTAVPFLDATVGKAMEASARLRSGQPEGAVAALLPAALANPYKGYVSWPGEGINPQSGSTPYFLPSQVTPGMQAARALGFQPASVARRQEFMSDQSAIKFATDQPQKDAANALAGIFARQADAQQKGDTASAAYYLAQGNKLIQQYGAALADPNTPAWEKVALPTRTALTNRIKLYLSQPGTLNIQRADKLKRQEMLNSPYLSQ